MASYRELGERLGHLEDEKTCDKCGRTREGCHFKVNRSYRKRTDSYKYYLEKYCTSCKNNSPGTRSSRKRRDNSRNKRLPIGPFRAWLLKYEGDIERLELAANLAPGTLMSVRGRSTRTHVEEDTVDRTLMFSNDGTTLYDMYPEVLGEL